MTAPGKMLIPPSIDLDGLEALIAEKEAKADQGLAYRTRTQAMLEDNEARARGLEAELAAQRAENVRIEANIEALAKLLARRRVFEADLAVELAIVNTAVAGLRQAGVTLSRSGDETTEKENE